MYKEIMGGAIGDIVSANVYWNGGQLWSNKRSEGWSDLEWMIRDWVNWAWLSGDHIVEQHVHNLDVASWFLGVHPDKAVGFGSRHRRPTGDQYDNFSIDFEYDDGRHMHSMCRQIHGCKNNVSEYFTGTNGFAAPHAFLKNSAGDVIWTYDEAVKAGMPKKPISPYQQEHVDLIWAIRTGNKIVEAENTAISTLTAIMGRTSAYTGQEVTWEQMMNSNDRLGPEPKELAFENKYVWVEDPVIPKPGAKKENA
jgi:predicted dehydrogenase